jgi:hypothetical protein
MRALRKGNTGKEVEILQGWLAVLGYYKAKPDGSYGPKTVEAVKAYQSKHGLVVDGAAGPITQKEMGFLKTKSASLVVLRIPFSKIKRAGLAMRDGKPHTVKSLAELEGYNFGVNAGFFSRDTLLDCTDTVLNGKLHNGGNYSDKGIAYGDPFEGVGMYPSTTANCIGKNVDFCGGVPPLIQNGKKNVDMKGIQSGIYTQITRRIATGVDRSAYYLIISIRNCSLETVVQEGLFHGVVFLKGNDGGGSQSWYMAGYIIIPTDGRKIPTAECLLVEREVS